MTTVTERELDALAVAINAMAKRPQGTFPVVKAVALYCKGRFVTSQWEPTPFLGDERCVLTGAYFEGGKLWASFKPAEPHKTIAWIRCDVNHAFEIFGGLRDALDTYLDNCDKAELAHVAHNLERFERSVAFEKAADGFPEYGTW